METKTRNSLTCYLLLTFALSSIFYVWSFAGGRSSTLPHH